MNSPYKAQQAQFSTRIILKAYGFNHFGEIVQNGERLRVSLIDITPGGARLRLLSTDAHQAPHPGDIFACNIQLPGQNLESGDIPCRTVWSDGDEFGVAFIKTLNTTVTDLQHSLDQLKQARAV